MSKLYFRDNGFVIPYLCEEVNANRRIVKILDLPKTNSPAKLFFLARPHSIFVPPLYLSVNQHQTISISPIGKTPAFFWYEIEIHPEHLVDGNNRFEFWSDGDAMDAWSIALDTQSSENASSLLSIDQGQKWENDHKGYLAISRGEYLIRIRLEEDQETQLPQWISEKPDHPRLASIREFLPQEVFQLSSTMEKIQCLSTWVSKSWEYCSSANASLYSPWDAATILSWTKNQAGSNGQKPMGMCVHYAVVFITACQALGITARGVVFTEHINSFNGHFAAEVWLPELNKWIFVDPNLDAFFFYNGLPLSVSELRNESDLTPFVSFGPGYTYQIQNPAIIEFMKIYLNGRFMKLRGVWPRNDFLSHPECTPPGHGSLAYCETDIIWEEANELAMFPYLIDSDYFNFVPSN